MTPAQALDLHRRMIAELGEAVIVRRYSGLGAARTHVDTATTGRVLSYQPNQIVGSVVQGDIRVIVLVDTLGAVLPLSTNDVLVVRGLEKAIKGVDDNTRRVQGTLIALDIHAEG